MKKVILLFAFFIFVSFFDFALAADFQISDPQGDVNYYVIPASEKPPLDVLEVDYVDYGSYHRVIFTLLGSDGQIMPPPNSSISYVFHTYYNGNNNPRSEVWFRSDGTISCLTGYSGVKCSDPQISGTTVSFNFDAPVPAGGSSVLARSIRYIGTSGTYADTATGTWPSQPVQQNCAQQNGDICSEAETCSGNWLDASDSERCCDVACQTPVCVENWQCSSWSSCSNNLQTRTCSDLNSCGTTQNKPSESQNCECNSGETRNCGIDVGECSFGNQTCSNNIWGICVGGINPVSEICDVKDNDCDGLVDEGCSCVPGLTKSCGTDVGECSLGVQTCQSNGQWGIECSGGINSVTEICGDSKDNDCDGNIDEDCVVQCVENWQCGEWGECGGDNKQIRICADGNDCGTFFNKPVEEQICGTVCEEEWECSEWNICIAGKQNRVCIDGNKCGTVGNKSLMEQNCEAEEKCVVGVREGGEYCDIDFIWKEQKDKEFTCENNYECKSNVCVDDNCIESGLFEKFVKWFKEFFGFVGTDEKIGESEEKFLREEVVSEEIVEDNSDIGLVTSEQIVQEMPFDGYIVELNVDSAVKRYVAEKSKLSVESQSPVRASFESADARLVFSVKKQIELVKQKQAEFKQEVSSVTQNLEVRHEYKILNLVDIGSVSEEEFEAIKALPSVKRIQPNYILQPVLYDSTSIIKANEVWQKDANRNNCSTSGEDCLTGKGVTIAIIDTGVDYTHPDLGGCTTEEFLNGQCEKVVEGWDFVSKDEDPMDGHGHGTHVASTAAGNGDWNRDGIVGSEEGLNGVAPDAEIYAYRVCNTGGCSVANILSAVERSVDPNQDGDLLDHVDVISMSLGGLCSKYNLDCGPEDVMSEAVDDAVGAGIVAVIAAGNDGPENYTVGSPGTSRKAITVAAFDKFDIIAGFSSRGPVTWKNSSGEVETIQKPDVAAPGVLICAAQWGDAWIRNECHNGQHIAISGTSMATPHVAGAAALLVQQHPEWIPVQVKAALIIGAEESGYQPHEQGSGRISSLNSYELSGNPVNDVVLATSGKTYGLVDVRGIVLKDGFVNYTLEIGEGQNPAGWTTLFASTVYPEDNVLLRGWETYLFEDGDYSLKLSSYGGSGKFGYDVRQVQIDNFDLILQGTVSGIINISGRVPSKPSFAYRVELNNEDGLSEPAVLIDQPATSFSADTLYFNWDTRVYVDGEYALKLVYYREDTGEELETESSRIIIRNNYLSIPSPLWLSEDLLEIIGTVSSSHASYYVLDWSKNKTSLVFQNQGINLENDGEQQVLQGLLGTFNTTLLSETGFYFLRLRVFDSDGQVIGEDFSELYVDLDQLQGWPVNIGTMKKNSYFIVDFPLQSSPKIEDLDNDGKKEVILSNGNKLFVINYDGTIRDGWPVEANWTLSATPAVADLNGDGVKEIIFPYGTPEQQTFGDARMNVFEPDGSMMAGARWPVKISRYASPSTMYFFREVFYWHPISPTVVDIDGNGKLEIVFADTMASPLGNGYLEPGKIYIWNHDGTNFMNSWPQPLLGYTSGMFTPFNVQPAVFGLDNFNAHFADVVGDGNLEIILKHNHYIFEKNDSKYEHFVSDIFAYDYLGNVLPGWPKRVDKSYRWDVVVGDVNSDGHLEVGGVVDGADGNYITFWNGEGNVVSSFLLSSPPYSLALGQFDGDEDLEIAVSYSLGVTVYNSDGSKLPGWPVYLPVGDGEDASMMYTSSVGLIVFDLDGDGRDDILTLPIKVPADMGSPLIFAYNSHGQSINGFPKAVAPTMSENIGQMVHATPAIGDLDGDGRSEMVIAGPDGKVYAFTLGSSYGQLSTSFPMYERDPRNIALYGELTYSKCVEGECIEVEGFGVDQCAQGRDCIDPVHMECVGMECIEVEGFGINQCTSDSVCYHSECIYGKCYELSGYGEKMCAMDDDCYFDLFFTDVTGEIFEGAIDLDYENSWDITSVGMVYGRDHMDVQIEVRGNETGGISFPNLNEPFYYYLYFEENSHASSAVYLFANGSTSCDDPLFSDIGDYCSNPRVEGNKIYFTYNGTLPSEGTSIFVWNGANEPYKKFDFVYTVAPQSICSKAKGKSCVHNQVCLGDLLNVSDSYSPVCCSTPCVNLNCGSLCEDYASNFTDCSLDLCGFGGCVWSRGNCVSSRIGWECQADSECNNGLYCDGIEFCNSFSGLCEAGIPPIYDDGVQCTLSACNEGYDLIEHVPNNELCGNGEGCVPYLGCVQPTFMWYQSDPISDVASVPIPSGQKPSLDIRSIYLFNRTNSTLDIYFEVSGNKSGDIGVNHILTSYNYALRTAYDRGLFHELILNATNGVKCSRCNEGFVNKTIISFEVVNNDSLVTFLDGIYFTKAALYFSTRAKNGTQIWNALDVSEFNISSDALCVDIDRDGYGGVRATSLCIHSLADCDDTRSNINPGASEICDDGFDNNCNGYVDYADKACESKSVCTSDENCTDNKICNGIEKCISGLCRNGAALQCDDELYCNGIETCDSVLGCKSGTAPNCNDGIACTIDSCNEVTKSCFYQENHFACDNGKFCDGSELCSIYNSGCVDGNAPNADDGVSCTADSCDEVNDLIVHLPQNNVCQDGLFCNGAEFCHSVLDCQAGDFPCNTGESCVESGDICEEIPNYCTEDSECNNNNVCDGIEKCVGNSCQSGDSLICDDGLYCNGVETCDSIRGCISGELPELDDEIACTLDSCDEHRGSIIHSVNDALCQDGLFCNGAEFCSAFNGCNLGAEPCATFGLCNELNDLCFSPTCNNDGFSDVTELCDGLDLSGESCESQDYPAGGNLLCNSSCSFDYRECSELPAYSKFNGETTEFEQAENIELVVSPVLEITDYGKINFEGQIINFKKLDLDSYVTIKERTIKIDTSGKEMNRLDVPAVLGFYNVYYTRPKVLVDGISCSEEICNVTEYDSIKHLLRVKVAGFSEYSVVEDVYCGDGICNNDETCGSCFGDCGVCPVAGGNSGGGGGSGGGSSEKYQCNDGIDNDLDGMIDYPKDSDCASPIDEFEGTVSIERVKPLSSLSCVESWGCREWSECVDKVKTRSCYDKNNCGTTLRQPELEQSCNIERFVGLFTESEIRFWRFAFIVPIFVFAIVVIVILFRVIKKRQNFTVNRERLESSAQPSVAALRVSLIICSLVVLSQILFGFSASSSIFNEIPSLSPGEEGSFVAHVLNLVSGQYFVFVELVLVAVLFVLLVSLVKRVRSR